jgi:hypothetical protein
LGDGSFTKLDFVRLQKVRQRCGRLICLPGPGQWETIGSEWESEACRYALSTSDQVLPARSALAIGALADRKFKRGFDAMVRDVIFCTGALLNCSCSAFLFTTSQLRLQRLLRQVKK